jgi:O-acetyl-ADP-ribose deacetylase (regulator of RNase III)
MALKIVNGDLLEAPGVDVIMHQSNCFSTMGKGIAKDIRHKFLAAYQADLRYYPNAPMDKLGKMSYAMCPHNHFGTKVVVVNLYGQYDFWKYGAPRDQVWTKYSQLESALRMAFDEPISMLVKDVGLANPKIGIPFRMGAGLANGDWDFISKIVNEVSNDYGHDIYAYKL